MTVLGSPTPRRLGIPANVNASFPDTPGTYTNPTGAIIVPGGALDRWWSFRPSKGSSRRELIAFGDSTTYGSGGNYSWLQRIRDRAVGDGYADGGKGIFAGLESLIEYDSPEVNGYVSSTFTGSTDSYDVLQGNFLYDNGTVANHTLTLQFKGTCARLWYSMRSTSGQFTYTVDGGSSTTVDAWKASGQPESRFVYLSGLSSGTHTVVITNLASTPNDVGVTKGCHIALAPMNATGLSVQKYAVSGATFANFNSVWRYWSAFGLTEPADRAVAANYATDTNQPSGGRAAPTLAILHLGFNDLTNQANTNYSTYTNGITNFAAACTAAGVDGLVLSGQLPYNSMWPTYGAGVFAAIRDTATSLGLAFADFFYPVGGASLSYSGGTSNPHLTKAQYKAQADWLWDNLLAIA